MKARDLEAALTHACACVALGYVARAARFARSWMSVPMLADAPARPLPTLSIVVPARNEERSIERCVTSLLAQRWLEFEVIVVDDGSSDATPRILERLAAADARLKVIRGAPLPEGWVGKPWALAQGAAAASGAWLLFTDADSAHEPEGSASTLRFALAMGADAISIGPYQELESFWERAVLPSVLGLILFAAGTLGEINDRRKPKRALANGQYIMVSRRAYDALGGHEALRAEIVEDVEFAKRIKSDGRFRYLLAAGYRVARVRMYHSFPEIWLGFTKNVFIGANGNLLVLALGITFMCAISIVPPALAVCAVARRRPALALEALATMGAVVAAASWGMRLAGFSRRLALYQPLGTAVFAAIIANSTFCVLGGKGVEWRGRRYHARK